MGWWALIAAAINTARASVNAQCFYQCHLRSLKSLEVLYLDTTFLMISPCFFKKASTTSVRLLMTMSHSILNKRLLPDDLVAGTLGKMKVILQVWHAKAEQM